MILGLILVFGQLLFNSFSCNFVGVMKSEKSLRVPNVFIAIGEEIVVAGKRYRCIERPDVHWRDCCRGCAFIGTAHCPPRVQCTKFTRRDGKFVWFIRESD